ncbi:phage head closure protein [Psychrobacter pacificensis]|uniref:phage head closure protein n=1 Tax=Psychrobacter pacificensis TaxID=112002 RepID=UPI001CBFFA1E|nr:phage head closure protein [Psychrobacter pacificensis]MBZ1392288.1 phage head closure protein [Psychrobacter pacificensis]
MRASRLRHRITVLKKTTTRSPTGAALPSTWTPYLTLWASIEPLSVKDVLTAQAASSQTIARCITRYRTDIDTSMRIEHNGQHYEINGQPLADARSGREHITLMLKSV